MHLGAGPVSLGEFAQAVRGGAFSVDQAVRDRLAEADARVEALVEGDAPIYGLNTALGAKLDARIAARDIPTFQRQVIEGRAVAVGEPLSAELGRATLLARILSAAQGQSGLSLPMFDHLCALVIHGHSPAIPAFGSVGAADLTQTAVWALAVLGEGRMWRGDRLTDAASALREAGLTVPPLGPRDGMALASQSGLTTGCAALALADARAGLHMARDAMLLSFAGYDADRRVLGAEVQALRPAPGQADAAAWLRDNLQTCEHAPRRMQEALSFRTAANVLGAAEDALERAVSIWQNEANGTTDSPALTPDGELVSTANFHAPALAIALEQVTLVFAMLANGSVQRIQKMMNPALSGLPRDLSLIGGASAGMVPLQKTSAALLADIRRAALPACFDAPPVSETVEDMAPMTLQTAQKLLAQTVPFHLLVGAEALVAAQAVDLRGAQVGGRVDALYRAIRQRVARLDTDRPLSADIERCAEILRAQVEVI